MTGKTNTSDITNMDFRAFVEKGLNADKTKRYSSVNELEKAFTKINF